MLFYVFWSLWTNVCKSIDKMAKRICIPSALEWLNILNGTKWQKVEKTNSKWCFFLQNIVSSWVCGNILHNFDNWSIITNLMLHHLSTWQSWTKFSLSLSYTFVSAVDRIVVHIKSQASFGFYRSWNWRTLPLFGFLCNFKPNKEPQEPISSFCWTTDKGNECVLFFRQINIHCAPSLLLRYFITANVFIGQRFVCLVT